MENKCLICERVKDDPDQRNHPGFYAGPFPNQLALADHLRRWHPNAAAIIAMLLEFTFMSDGGKRDVIDILNGGSSDAKRKD